METFNDRLIYLYLSSIGQFLLPNEYITPSNIPIALGHFISTWKMDAHSEVSCHICEVRL